MGNPDCAAQWLSKMIEAGVEANVQSYSSVISAFARVGDVSGVEHWLRAMEDVGIKGDTISFTAAINACARTGDMHRAEGWLAKMLDAGVEPNVITFNAVIAACAKAGNGKRCEEWLEKMRRAGVQPNSFTYNSAAKPFVAKGDYERVEKYMKDLRSDGSPMDDFCLTSLVHAYGNAKPKQVFRAQAALKHFVASGGQLSDNSKRALQLVGVREDGQLCSPSSKHSPASRTKLGRYSPSSQSVKKAMQAPPGLENEVDMGSPAVGRQHTQSPINLAAHDFE